jgi:hypothetical protein
MGVADAEHFTSLFRLGVGTNSSLFVAAMLAIQSPHNVPL